MWISIVDSTWHPYAQQPVSRTGPLYENVIAIIPVYIKF